MISLRAQFTGLHNPLRFWKQRPKWNAWPRRERWLSRQREKGKSRQREKGKSVNSWQRRPLEEPEPKHMQLHNTQQQRHVFDPLSRCTIPTLQPGYHHTHNLPALAVGSTQAVEISTFELCTMRLERLVLQLGVHQDVVRLLPHHKQGSHQ